MDFKIAHKRAHQTWYRTAVWPYLADGTDSLLILTSCHFFSLKSNLTRQTALLKCYLKRYKQGLSIVAHVIDQVEQKECYLKILSFSAMISCNLYIIHYCSFS